MSDEAPHLAPSASNRTSRDSEAPNLQVNAEIVFEDRQIAAHRARRVLDLVHGFFARDPGEIGVPVVFAEIIEDGPPQ